MLQRGTWLMMIAIMAAACARTPTVTEPPVPSPPAVRTPTPAPSPLVGLPHLRLAPGEALDFEAAPGGKRRLLVANAADAESEVVIRIDPEGAPAASPTPEPSKAPPPFGFGAGPTGDGAAAPFKPVTRRVLAEGEPRVGMKAKFWINNGDTTLAGDQERMATLRLISPNAYFLVDETEGKTIEQPALQRLSDAFEARIRPPLVQAFGEEPRPGIDGEDRLFIVLSPWVGQAPDRQGMMGYFWPRDPVAKGGSGDDLRQHANEKEVIFLSSAILKQPEVTAYGTLAHEYQHLLMFAAKSAIDGRPRTEDTWLDEGFSMLAMDLAGFGLGGGDPFVAREIADFQRAPAAYSLTDWKNNPNGFSYGLSYLFCRYLVDRFGLSLLKQVHDTPETGVAGLDQVLRSRGSDFQSVFLDFAVANRPKDEEGSAFRPFAWLDLFGTYGEVQLPGAQPLSLHEAGKLTLRPWSMAFLSVEGLEARPRTLTLEHATGPVAVLEPGGREVRR